MTRRSMSDIHAEIEQLYDDGYSSVEISSLVGVTLDQVDAAIQSIEEYRFDMEQDSLDFMADAEVLASAGWGTDEDYGYYGEE